MKWNVKQLILAAAGLCLAFVALCLVKQNVPTEPVKWASPPQYRSAEEVADFGYDFPIPDGAEDVHYTLIERDREIPMAHASFLWQNRSFRYRALKTGTEVPADISGLRYEWEIECDWDAGGLSLQYRAVENGESWIGWFDADEGVQWCLGGNLIAQETMFDAAQSIIDQLGYDVLIRPAVME
ncbi:MAG: hypothetical protein IKM54_04960 [Butyricicoccus sp.]|nr:hypothetical protein [Butyricicoccus sp.]